MVLNQAKTSINIFWFKRDLRLTDNDGLHAAIGSGLPLVLIYLYEATIWNDPHYDSRHLNFIKESLRELNDRCAGYGLQVMCVKSEAVPFFRELFNRFAVNSVFSSRETGLHVTFQRDLAFAQLCRDHHISWREFQNNGVLRAISNRDDWRASWYEYMRAPQAQVSKEIQVHSPIETVAFIDAHFPKLNLDTSSHDFQKGGRSNYEQWRDSFFNERLAYYSDYISKPERSRYGCSRLSPYISWGVCSIRELYQHAEALRKNSPHKCQLSAFVSRLRWQSHFIQKFESEPRMELEAVNKGFLEMPQPLNEHFVQAWKEGKTGYPLMDAAQRCVAATGYINFRMRAMVTSFLTHHLFQHFTTGSTWLARQFLDFEPGIHYGQFQMQAGLTGTNTVRVYNPVKNALDHDPEAIFIKKWVHELRELPVQFAIEPWKMTMMEEQLYSVELGVDYPHRIVDLKVGRANALEKLYGLRKSDLANSERLRILKKHTIRKPSDKDDAKRI